MKIVIVTGMSGAGKTAALRMLEDDGYYCVDNMPISLVIKFAELAAAQEDGYSNIALGVDIRSGRSLGEFAAILDATLKEVNSDYEAKRWKDIALQPLEVIVAREGLFHDWLAQKGKLGGQHKVPRLSNTREYIETMLALNDSIPSEE